MRSLHLALNRLLGLFAVGADLPYHTFLGDSGHSTKPKQLRCLYPEKCLDMWDSANATAAQFVSKFHAVRSSQISHLWRMRLKLHCFSHEKSYEHMSKTDLKTNGFLVFERTQM